MPCCGAAVAPIPRSADPNAAAGCAEDNATRASAPESLCCEVCRPAPVLLLVAASLTNLQHLHCFPLLMPSQGWLSRPDALTRRLTTAAPFGAVSAACTRPRCCRSCWHDLLGQQHPPPAAAGARAKSQRTTGAALPRAQQAAAVAPPSRACASAPARSAASRARPRSSSLARCEAAGCCCYDACAASQRLPPHAHCTRVLASAARLLHRTWALVLK